jgi:hypothetical protein
VVVRRGRPRGVDNLQAAFAMLGKKQVLRSAQGDKLFDYGRKIDTDELVAND